MQRICPDSANGAISASKRRPPAVTIWYVPCIDPNGVPRGQPDVYSNDSPGARVGWRPTTPSPLTSWTFSAASVMSQWRLINWTVSGPSLAIVMV